MLPISKVLGPIRPDQVLQRLRDSIRTALRVTSVIALFYFFDNWVFTAATSNLVLKPILFALQFGLGTLAKVLIISGGLATVAMIAVGEEALLKRDRMLTQMRRNWKAVLGCAFIPAAIHFAAYLLTGKYPVPFEIIASICNIPLLVFLALYFDSYHNGNPHPPRHSLDVGTCLLMLFTYFLDVLFAYLVYGYWRDNFIAASLLSFALKFLELVFFIFLIRSLYPPSPIPSGPGRTHQLILVNPPFSGTLQALGSLVFWSPPPALIIIRALTPRKYQIREFNRVLWSDQYYEGGALVGISCLTANSAEAYKIAKEFKKRGSKVVMGGPHVSIFPDEALEFCDSVVIGPVESVWSQVLHDHEKGELRAVYQSFILDKDVDTVRQYLAEQPPAVIASFLETRRGCKFKCYFCAMPFWQEGFDACANDIDQMLVYLKKISARTKKICFIDSNIYADPEYFKKLLKAMVPFHFQWVGSSSIDIASDDKTIELLKESGCCVLLIGYEVSPGSEESGRGGKLALAAKYVELTMKLKRAGIKVKGHFIYGFENDGLASLLRLWLFCVKLWPQFTVLSFLTPIPGSAFFEDMVRGNKLRDINWRSYNLHTLVYDNPRLDNFLFRKAFSVVMLFFLCTTSNAGVLILGGYLLLFFFLRMISVS